MRIKQDCNFQPTTVPRQLIYDGWQVTSGWDSGCWLACISTCAAVLTSPRSPKLSFNRSSLSVGANSSPGKNTSSLITALLRSFLLGFSCLLKKVPDIVASVCSMEPTFVMSSQNSANFSSIKFINKKAFGTWRYLLLIFVFRGLHLGLRIVKGN